ncbi:PilN domain-containing protein [Kineococcus sp. NBC_00420]|uniref:PilN domain-containing protein n=1 Tax=Kineococcus sp. NBC_00420 TaxID=2903564 RepID=UPI002E1B7B7C
MSFQTLEAVASRTRPVRVNLLPTGFDKPRRERRLRIGLGITLLAVVAASGAGYYITLGHVGDANSRLETAQFQTAELQRAQQPYAEVPKILARVKAVQDVRDQVSASDVPYYAMLDRLATAAPADLSMSTITFASAAATNGSASPAATASAGTAGTLTISGKALSMDTIAAWMDSIDAVPGFAGAAISDANRDDQGVITFNATVTLTSAALSSNQ